MNSQPCQCGRIPKVLRRNMCNTCYENYRYRMNAYGQWSPDRTAAEPVRVHVQALMDAGMSRKKVARAAGLPPQTVAYLLQGRPGREPAKRVAPRTAAAVLAVVFDGEPGAFEYVPALGAQRRLRALIASGWTFAALADQLGAGTRPDVSHLLRHQSSVRAWRHTQIVALYSRLQLTPGLSEAARRLGRINRWPLPFQWDEEALDDPGKGPVHMTRREPYFKRARLEGVLS